MSGLPLRGHVAPSAAASSEAPPPRSPGHRAHRVAAATGAPGPSAPPRPSAIPCPVRAPPREDHPHPPEPHGDHRRRSGPALRLLVLGPTNVKAPDLRSGALKWGE
ncbi:hypothetical protein EST54_03015 [Streptomyces sioyaensis]|uniref:Uncharacterized protein n=1 Tax=Streptomyces sioyaensis TaxID=67364 RepID=A0A4Q1RAD1_9ACTN|nr:hypothetical protein EST54_03015 [Streptomyces sioyaensis]